MFAGSSASYDEGGKGAQWASFLSQRDYEYRPSEVLGIGIDDTSIPLFRTRALDWLEAQLLRDIRIISRFIWGRR